VKIPPWVLQPNVDQERSLNELEPTQNNALILRNICVKIDALYADKFEAFIDNGRAKLFCREFDAQEEGWP
jgi:hypothetical protein